MLETNEAPTSVKFGDREVSLVVNRNSIDKVLTATEFGAKSDNKGKTFYYPEITLANIQKDMEWVGLEEVANSLNKLYRRVFADIYLGAIDETTGVLNVDQMVSDWAEFTAGIPKLDDIDEQLDILQAEQQKYALDPQYEFGEVDDNGTPTAQAAKTAALIREVNQKIRPLRAQKASIEAKYAERAAKRKAKKEAAEAAKAKGSPVTA